MKKSQSKKSSREKEKNPVNQILGPSKRLTRNSMKKRYASSKRDPATSSTPINIYDLEECTPSIDSHAENPPPNSPIWDKLSLLADVATGSVFSIGYVEGEYDIPLAILIKKTKKRKIVDTQEAIQVKETIIDKTKDTIP